MTLVGTSVAVTNRSSAHNEVTLLEPLGLSRVNNMPNYIHADD